MDNQIFPNGAEDGDDNVSDGEEDDDIGPDIRDDILKPASTRSKIVVNLVQPKDEHGKKRDFAPGDKIQYELDPYDKVRMRLLKPNEDLYKSYLKTIEQI